MDIDRLIVCIGDDMTTGILYHRIMRNDRDITCRSQLTVQLKNKRDDVETDKNDIMLSLIDIVIVNRLETHIAIHIEVTNHGDQFAEYCQVVLDQSIIDLNRASIAGTATDHDVIEAILQSIDITINQIQCAQVTRRRCADLNQ